MTSGSETATFGAGCFWGVQSRFDAINGVTATEAGYSGGMTDNPTYQQVCSKTTGHVEVVRVEYDPSVVSYESLLDAFFDMHNPTTRNRQGTDVGSQYRSVIFTASDALLDRARAHVKNLSQVGSHRGAPGPILTEIAPAPEFWRAEDYHQGYLTKHGRASCAL